MSKFLEIVSVTKTYHNGRQEVFALMDVSLSLEKGDFLAVVGPSGSGKSTLLHVLGGLEPPQQGEVFFQGKNIYSMKDKALAYWRSRTAGFVFQFFHLVEELNVLENIALSCFCWRAVKSSFKKAQGLLKYLGIEERAYFFPSQLSGGEKQKTAIARALINEPDIILCDEPTGNLDKDSQEKVIGVLEKLNREEGKTVIMVTHNLELAKRAKRILEIKDGIISG